MKIRFLFPLLLCASAFGQTALPPQSFVQTPEAPMRITMPRTELRAMLLDLLGPEIHAQAVTPAPAPVWFPVAKEGDSISVPSATVRYGSPNCTPSATVPCWVQISVSGKFIANNAFFKTDPAPFIVKELDVLETNVAQTVMVNGVAKTVPALPVVVVTPPVVTVAGKYTLSASPTNPLILTINSDGSFTLTGGGVAVKQ